MFRCCYGCKRRTVTCHDDCPDYLSAKAKVAEKRRERRGQMLAGDLLREGAERMAKKQNRRTR